MVQLEKTTLVLSVTVVSKPEIRSIRPLTLCYGTLYYDAVSISFSENPVLYVVGSYSQIWHHKYRTWTHRPFVAEHFHVRTTKDVSIILNRQSGPEIFVKAGTERYVNVKTVQIFLKRSGDENGIAYFTFEGTIVR